MSTATKLKLRRPGFGVRVSRGLELLRLELQQDLFLGKTLSANQRRDLRACLRYLEGMEAWGRERRAR